jgi:Polyketide cyclase / dehydrase and lipid transport
MGEQKIRIHAESMLDVSAQVVYDIIADYRIGHPEIAPKPYFQGIEVESGGVGAGTLITVTMRVLGTTSTMRQRVSEPVPGRVLVESNVDGTLDTTFTVTPADGGDERRATVSITTLMQAHSGVRGSVERWITPRILRPIYQKELQLLEALAKRRMAETGTTQPAG